jgi:hypothetical protein
MHLLIRQEVTDCVTQYHKSDMDKERKYEVAANKISSLLLEYGARN